MNDGMRIVFGIGTELDGTGGSISREDVNPMTVQALRLVSQYFGGGFVTQGQGAWMDPDGRLIMERGITITTDITDGDYDPARIDYLANLLRDIFRQQAVHVTLVPVEFGDRYADQGLFPPPQKMPATK